MSSTMLPSCVGTGRPVTKPASARAVAASAPAKRSATPSGETDFATYVDPSCSTSHVFEFIPPPSGVTDADSKPQ